MQIMDTFSTVKIPEELHELVSRIPSLSVFDAVVAGTAIWAFLKLVRMSRRRVRTTRLKGPPSPSFMFGVGKILLEAEDPTSIYESWADEYGAAYEAPATLGRRRVILYDPKAIAHFHAKQTWTYVRTPMAKKSIEHGFGRGIFWADGESHSRQRKSLTPAFSIAAIRHLTPIFYDSAYKAKGAWNALIESSGEDGAIIDVQNCLDTIGLAGFSHDFGALDGKHASVTEIFDSFTSSTSASAINIGVGLLADVFPSLVRLPTRRQKLMRKLNDAMEEISTVLLARTKQEMDAGIVGDKEEKSVIGLLIKGQRSESEFHLSKEEVLAQMKVLLLAGYETTSISVTWALIELSRNPDIQTKLRNELIELGPADPTYDQLSNGLPYLDAVVHETLRMHAPVRETTRMADEDDVIPLSEPVRTKSGQLVENLSIAKGTVLSIPIASVNLSAVVWGEDAKVFNPSRWLEGNHGNSGIPAKAKEDMSGKNFAVIEFKAVLSVLVKNFVFELRDGQETKIEMGRGFLPRPRVAGEVGCKTPLRVKPYTGHHQVELYRSEYTL
ncbi:cytochrome P450 [Boletus reticuloceps]|uniref:Cytochrome P450 n=1 Tax=Boletus reticuloceps TaxID=495285 RepID=A0A8I2YNL0_9AGAM|nr:cytochrome P450 [Boletus reticuloceps]